MECIKIDVIWICDDLLLVYVLTVHIIIFDKVVKRINYLRIIILLLSVTHVLMVSFMVVVHK